MFATKLTEKIPDPNNAKEYYQSYLSEKNTKLVKWSKIINQEPEALENPSIVIKSVTIEHSKNSHKLSKAIRQDEKLSQEGADKNSDSSLFSETRENLLDEKHAKIK